MSDSVVITFVIRNTEKNLDDFCNKHRECKMCNIRRRV